MSLILNSKIVISLSVIILVTLSGCATRGRPVAESCKVTPLTVETDAVATHVELSQFVGQAIHFCAGTHQKLNAMVISGGGADAAYGAGLISGLLESQQLNAENAPCYITGVSAGAIMAPYVYLATSSDAHIHNVYQEKLRSLFLSIDDEHLLSFNNPIAMLSQKSMYNARKIYETMDKQLDAEMLSAVVAEYQRSGRKMYIGVVDIYNSRFEILDLTELFAQAKQRPDQRVCIIESIRASAAIPVVFEPVDMQGVDSKKLYIDGGMRYPLFLDAALLETLRRAAGLQDIPVRVMTIVNHPGVAKTLSQDTPDIEDISWRKYMDAVGEITRNQRMMDAAAMVQTEILHYGYEGLWANGQVGRSCIAQKNHDKIFDAAYQRCLFDIGLRQGHSMHPWQAQPLLPDMHGQHP